jgi:hypothetical protein
LVRPRRRAGVGRVQRQRRLDTGSPVS